MDRPTFILGIGCQKAGTTWLWRYLNSADGVSLAYPKELHVFDAMLRPDLNAEFYLKAQIERLSKPAPRGFLGRRGKSEALRGPRHANAEKRMEMIGNPEAYIDFFRDMAKDARAVGEITPSYATLYPGHFRFIRELLEPHFELRVILLLRDPVQRAFSSAKLFMRVNAEAFPVALSGDPNAYLESLLSSPYILERQNYERVLGGLDRAFEPGEVHVEFYERLFTQPAVQAIAGFLAIDEGEADFSFRKNEGPSKAALEPALATKAREASAETYAYCKERFGKGLIKDLWPESQSA